MAETTRATDSVEVGLSRRWEVKVDDYVHSLDVNPTGQEICEGWKQFIIIKNLCTKHRCTCNSKHKLL